MSDSCQRFQKHDRPAALVSEAALTATGNYVPTALWFQTQDNHFNKRSRQFRHFFKAFFTITAIGILVASTCFQTWADDAGKDKPLALRTIMQNLGKNMQGITDGISREDWEIVKKIAPLIADHPQPPLVEKMQILSFVGSDTGKFKSHDEKTHQAAQTLEQAAAGMDGQAVILSFATLQNNCRACHQNFRKPFLEHFYGQH